MIRKRGMVMIKNTTLMTRRKRTMMMTRKKTNVDEKKYKNGGYEEAKFVIKRKKMVTRRKN